MSEETTQEIKEKVEGKRRHRWYHWLFLVLAVLLSLFNLFEGVIFEYGVTKLISNNIQAFFKGEGPVSAPETMEIVGDDVVYVNTENRYSVTIGPENVMDIYTLSEYYDITIETDSEGTTIDNDLPRGVYLEAGGEGTVTITAEYLSWPYLTATKTITITKRPITYINTRLRSDTELKCGAYSQLVVTNDNYSLDLSRINFYSTNTDVASIDEEGYIKTLSAGTAEVYAVSAEDETVSSEPIEITVTEETFIAPTSIRVDPIKNYAKDLHSVYTVFNNGEECDDCLYVVTCEDEDIVRMGGYIYSEEAMGPVNIRVSSVYDPSVYCDTTVEFAEVKATGLSLVSPANGSLLGRWERHYVEVDVISELEGVEVTYDELSYDVIEGEDVCEMKGNAILGTETMGWFTLRISLVNDPSIYIDVSYETYYDDSDADVTVLKVFGHFLPYAANGVLFAYVMYWFCLDLQDEKKKKRNVLILVSFVVLGFLVSLGGEFVQLIFNPTRHATWVDVGINFGGFAFGFAVALLIIYLYRRHKDNQTKKVLTKGI